MVLTQLGVCKCYGRVNDDLNRTYMPVMFSVFYNSSKVIPRISIFFCDLCSRIIEFLGGEFLLFKNFIFDKKR
jgi:hypothetical protein